jgi:hypothetical protein
MDEHGESANTGASLAWLSAVLLRKAGLGSLAQALRLRREAVKQE